MERITPICPECEADDSLTLVQEEHQTAIYDVQLFQHGGTVHAVEADEEMDTDGYESEFVSYRCNSCGYETDHEDDFIPDPEEDEEA